MQIPRYILVLVALLVFALMVVSLMFIWFPDLVSADTFVRLLVSFCVVMLGAVLLAAVGRILSKNENKD